MKSYTDLEQSKKLAEILPIESADMFYRDNGIDVKLMWEHITQKVEHPCWSLAALLDTFDDIVVDDEGNEYSLKIFKEEGLYYINYYDRWKEVDNIETDCYYDLVDACYEMIIKLKERNLL